MAKILPFERPRPKRWTKSPSSFVEVSSQSSDSTKFGVGTSPFLGDVASLGVAVPAAATLTQTTRYLVRLCTLDIPSGMQAMIRGVRQNVVIGAIDSNGYPVEREVESPSWSFTDGNISWHIRHMLPQESRTIFDAAQTAGTEPSTAGTDPALLYNQPLAPAYVPPGAGMPPGKAIGQLGTWRDLRYPWTNTDWSLRVPVIGSGRIVFFASIRQTNPESRVAPANCPPSLSGLRVEDQFLASVPLAVYRRVAGAMLIEQFAVEAIP